MQQKFPDFFHYFFVYQHFHRFSQSAFNNAQPFWFYLAVIALTSLPWTPWLISRWRLKHEFHDTTTIALRTLFWLWIGVITLFFSIPTSKLVGYVLPVMPALAALIAEGLANVVSFSRRWKSAMVVMAAALCVGSIVAITRADDITSKPLVAAYRQNAAPGEPLVFLQTYRFDVPFYARLTEPIIIIDKWDEPIVKDSWSKEMADAAKFRPTAGEKVLVNTPEMRKVLCAQPVTWVIAPTSYMTNSKEFNSLEPVTKNSLYALVKISSSYPSLGCP
jgi:4-amino-4-deoxy-L-arabinose transferase-like glycosyltransferase